jgi:transcriptional/translational regulatory protein YebC/TACO1
MIFKKGQLGNTGSVAYMFDRVGVIEATHADKTFDLESVAIEAGAQNVEPLEKDDVPAGNIGGRFFTIPTDLDIVNKFLTQNKWAITQSELSYLAKNVTELEGEAKKEVVDFLNAIDDNDDVHRLYTALKA